MRSALLLLLACSACNPQVPAPGEAPSPASVQERLLDDTRLLLSSADSAGSLTAERHVQEGWMAGLVDLAIDNGELVVTADDETLTITTLAVGFQPLDIPVEVFGGHMAQIKDLRVELAHPVIAPATWRSKDEVHVNANLDVKLTWALAIDGSPAPLGSPKLPPVPVELVVTGDGEHVHAEVHASAAGELWSWASLVRISDLALILDASSVETR